MSTRTTTIRMSEEMAQEVELVARVEVIPVSVLIRSAIEQHIEQRMADPLFRASAAAVVARDQARLSALGPLAASRCCCDQTAARLVICPEHPTAAPASSAAGGADGGAGRG